jgi:hypothetical protein
MRLDLRRMPFPELAQLLRDIAREIEQRGRTSNPQFRDERAPSGGFASGGGFAGPMQRGGPRGKKRFPRPPFRGGPNPNSNSQPGSNPPPHDEDFNR